MFAWIYWLLRWFVLGCTGTCAWLSGSMTRAREGRLAEIATVERDQTPGRDRSIPPPFSRARLFPIPSRAQACAREAPWGESATGERPFAVDPREDWGGPRAKFHRRPGLSLRLRLRSANVVPE